MQWVPALGILIWDQNTLVALRRIQEMVLISTVMVVITIQTVTEIIMIPTVMMVIMIPTVMVVIMILTVMVVIMTTTTGSIQVDTIRIATGIIPATATTGIQATLTPIRLPTPRP